MEATIVYWGYIGIMEKKMEATIGVQLTGIRTTQLAARDSLQPIGTYPLCKLRVLIAMFCGSILCVQV